VGILGAASCFYVMSGLPQDTWLRLILWLEVGLMIYAGYGWRKSRIASDGSDPARLKPHSVLLAISLLAFIPTVIYAIKYFGKGA
jgi:hypothetical protein